MNGSKVQQNKFVSNKKIQSNNNQSVYAPTAITQRSKNSNPKKMYMANGDCVIRHREFFSDIQGSVATSIHQYSINSGLSLMFPWLSAVANRFETYLFRSLKFEFLSEAATTSTGSIVLGIDYDATDPAPSTKVQLLSYQESVRSSPWSQCVHVCNKQNLNKRSEYYTRSGGNPSGTDLKLYDVGNLFVLTQGQVTNAIIGELWVDYEVLLCTPQLDPSTDFVGLQVRATTALDSTHLMGTAPTIFGGGLNCNIFSNGIQFQQDWEGYVTFIVTGTTIVGDVFVQLSNTVTIVSDANSIINTSQTKMYDLWVIKAQAGQFLAPQVTSAGVSQVDWYLGSSSV